MSQHFANFLLGELANADHSVGGLDVVEPLFQIRPLGFELGELLVGFLLPRGERLFSSRLDFCVRACISTVWAASSRC